MLSEKIFSLRGCIGEAAAEQGAASKLEVVDKQLNSLQVVSQ